MKKTVSKRSRGLSPRLRKHYKTRFLVVENGKAGLLYRAWIEDSHFGKCLAICHNRGSANRIAKVLNSAHKASR